MRFLAKTRPWACLPLMLSAACYEVLEAQQQLFPAQLNLARTQREQQLAVVALYKALGGGWKDIPTSQITLEHSG